MMVVRKRDYRVTLTQNLLCSTLAGVASRTTTAPLDVVKIRLQVGTPDTHFGVLKTVHNIYHNSGFRGLWRGNIIACTRLLPFSVVQLGTYHRLKLALVDECGRLSLPSAAVAGTGAAIMATATFYPLDVMKTRFIIWQDGLIYRNGVYNAARVIWQQEGFSTFYRGLPVTIIAMVPYSATTFIAYELMERVCGGRLSQSPVCNSFFIGCIAASFAQTFTYPLDTIRKIMQASSSYLMDKGDFNVTYTNSRDVIKYVIRRRGIAGLWKGILPSLIKVAPQAGVMFMVYEKCKNLCLYHNGYTTSPFWDYPDEDVDQSLMPHEVVIGNSSEETNMGFIQSEDDG